MNSIVKFLALSFSAAYLVGCASTGPVAGALYTDVEYGGDATGQTTGMQKGTSCASSVLGLIATGDASVMTAARAGKISTISHVDHSTWSILMFYNKYCTTVYGKSGGSAAAAKGAPAAAAAPKDEIN